MPPGRLIYMNIPAVRPEKEESFEERRFVDYTHAYQTTGRPPVPCPDTPTNPQQRATMGLPPLFEPYSELENELNGIGVGSLPPTITIDFAAQAFSPTKTQDREPEIFQHIVAHPHYATYSPEELRLEAYRLGKQFNPDVAHVLPPSLVSSLAPPRPPRTVHWSSSTYAHPAGDSLQSINSMHPYDQHSFEELRLAFILAGRPLSSAEIIAQNATLRLTV